MVTDVFNTQEQSNIKAIKYTLVNTIINNSLSWIFGQDDCVIAGGYFVSSILEENYNDIDIFILNNNEDINFGILKKYCQSSSDWVLRDKSSTRYLKNPHVISVMTNKSYKIQFIVTDHKSRKELLNDFDYLHCTISYVPTENKLYITRSAYDAIICKELIINNKKTQRIWRREKFEKLGWKCVNKTRSKHEDIYSSILASVQSTSQEQAFIFADALDILKRSITEEAIDPQTK